MGKGTIGLNPFYHDRTIMSHGAMAGLLSVIVSFTDAKSCESSPFFYIVLCCALLWASTGDGWAGFINQIIFLHTSLAHSLDSALERGYRITFHTNPLLQYPIEDDLSSDYLRPEHGTCGTIISSFQYPLAPVHTFYRNPPSPRLLSWTFYHDSPSLRLIECSTNK